jgi:excisionase family DNA binding protein
LPKKPLLNPIFVGPSDAVRLAGVSRSRVYQLLASGQIPSRKDGRRRLIRVADIEKWFSRLPPSPLTPRPLEPATGPLLPTNEQRLAIELASEPDWAAVHSERLTLLLRDVPQAEAEARAFEYVVGLYRKHHGCDLETAKAAVLAAIEQRAKGNSRG